jgi:hypothetical protein
MTTVGYGDMTVLTVREQVFCVIVMIFGVFYFGSISGSLYSMLASMDHSSAEMEKKVILFQLLQNQFTLSPSLITAVQKSMNYDNRMATNGIIQFVQSMPPHLRITLTMAMYRRVFRKHEAFKSLQSTRLLTYIGQSLRPSAYEAG